MKKLFFVLIMILVTGMLLQAQNEGLKYITRNDFKAYMSFESKKVPYLFFISGVHADLHSIRDNADKIDYDKMGKVSKLVYLIGYNVANSKEGIKTDIAK